MTEAYFAFRLGEELYLAEGSTCDDERVVRLRACYLLWSMLGLRLDSRLVPVPTLMPWRSRPG